MDDTKIKKLAGLYIEGNYAGPVDNFKVAEIKGDIATPPGFLSPGEGSGTLKLDAAALMEFEKGLQEFKAAINERLERLQELGVSRNAAVIIKERIKFVENPIVALDDLIRSVENMDAEGIRAVNGIVVSNYDPKKERLEDLTKHEKLEYGPKRPRNRAERRAARRKAKEG